MRKFKLLIFLGLASLYLTLFVAAQGPKQPEVKRRGDPSKPAEKPSRWSREQQKENVKRAPERENAGKKSTREERPRGLARTREKANAWDRRLQRAEAGRTTAGKTQESKLTERGQRLGRVEKASRWERRQSQRVRELRPSQRPQFLEHLFRGQVNKKGKATGFHYEGAQMEAVYGTKVIEGTRTAPDAYGVYKARVEVRGVEKKEPSSFFPRSWSRADVVKAINESYTNRVAVAGRAPNYLQGRTSGGLTIGMYSNKNGEIITAFPIYAGK